LQTPPHEPAVEPAAAQTTAPARSLSGGAAINLAARLATVLMGLAILTVVARLSPQVQGAFALFVAIEAALLALFSGLGLWLAREVSHRGVAPSALLRRLLAYGLVAGVLAGMLLAAAAQLTEADPYRHLGLLALAAPFLLMVPTASGLWLGQGRMLPLNLPQVAAPALVLVGLMVLGQRSEAVDAPVLLFSVLAVWVAAKAAVGAGTAALAWFDARRAALDGAANDPAGGPADGPPALSPVRAAAVSRADTESAAFPPGALRFAATVALTNLVSLLNYRATLFIVEREAGLAATGVYSVAVQVAELLWLLSSAVTVSAYHRIGAPEAAAAARTTLAAVRFNLAATLLAAPLLYLGATLVLPVWLGAAYAPALGPLALLLPGVAAYAAASSLSAYFTNQRGRPQWSAAIAGLSLALTLAIASFAVPRYGAGGAAAATSLAYAIAIGVALRSFLRDAGLPWRAVIAPNRSN